MVKMTCTLSPNSKNQIAEASQTLMTDPVGEPNLRVV